MNYGVLKHLSVDQLERGQYQPRRHFDETELAELADSSKSAGLIQPIVVRPITEKTYEIIAGERRWRAAQLAGIGEVPCIINHYSDEQAAAVATIENLNRVNLNPIEEAEAYQRLIEEFSYAHEEVAAIIGKSRAKITNMLRLLRLDERIKKFIINGRINEGQAKVLAGLPVEQQMLFAEKCASADWSVRKLESEIRKYKKREEGSGHSDVDIRALEESLKRHMGCDVSVIFNNDRCQLQLNCSNLDIFQGILDQMGFDYNKIEE